MTVESFGSYLRFLRRRARMTQTELSTAVGYSPGQISMLENGQRQPNVAAVSALFIAALGLQQDIQASKKLIELATAAKKESQPAEPAGGGSAAAFLFCHAQRAG
jgi:transcriptional regulator with XRE-family HTH domain